MNTNVNHMKQYSNSFQLREFDVELADVVDSISTGIAFNKRWRVWIAGLHIGDVYKVITKRKKYFTYQLRFNDSDRVYFQKKLSAGKIKYIFDHTARIPKRVEYETISDSLDAMEIEFSKVIKSLIK